MSLGDSPKGVSDRLSFSRRVRRARRRLGFARLRLSRAIPSKSVGSEATEVPSRAPKSLCRTCGTTFETLAYTCSECGGATIEPMPPRADGGFDDIVENPP